VVDLSAQAPGTLQVVGDVARTTARRTVESRLTGLAAEMAFWTVLSLVPALLALASLLASLDGLVGQDLAQRAEDNLVDAVQRVLSDGTGGAGGVVDAVRDLFSQPRPGLLSVAIVLTVWSASRGFAVLTDALDRINDTRPRTWLRRRLLGLGLVTGTLVVATLLLGVLVAGPLFGTGQELADDLGFGSAFATAWDWVRLPVALVVSLAWLTTVFHLAPSRRDRWRQAFPGAVLTVVLWFAFSIGLRLYAELQSGNAVVGSLGGLLIVLLWVWLMSLAQLLGGLLNAVLADRTMAAPAARGGSAPAGGRGTSVDSGS
jgi:membrane protein